MDRALRRAVRHLVGSHSICLFPHSVHGYGGFKPFAERVWPKASRVGLPKSGGGIDYLICIADADRAAECCSAPISAAPAIGTRVWVNEASAMWTTELQAMAGASAEKVFGKFIRWNRESLLIASFDHAESQNRLGIPDGVALDTVLDPCDPDPRTEGVVFADAYQKPVGCFEQCCKAANVPPI
ncbi:MAG: hypothetical protein JRH20_31825, partial [Deltaproteobacteria bacterium]|nr:hypothetical protein [Deltaproteobacteria bacterium]